MDKNIRKTPLTKIKAFIFLISLLIMVLVPYFYQQTPAWADMSIVISSSGTYYLTDVHGKKLLPTFQSNEKAYVYYKYGIYFVNTTYGKKTQSSSPLRFVPTSSSVLMKVNNMPYYNVFRGVMEVRYSNFSKLLWAIEEVRMQDYLKGVAEEPESYNNEAMRAGVVAYRSYAYANMYKDTYYSYEPFDISSSTSFQRYAGRDNWYVGYVRETHGTSPNKNSRAVDDTGGQVMLYQGKPARTVYFGSCDGKTLTHSVLPYLKSKPEPYCVGRTRTAHGYGMCMYGAQQRAIRDHWSYKQMLSYYYTGISLVNIGNPLIRVGVYSTSIANDNFPRYEGSDSYGTTVALSQRGWPSGANTVVLARGDFYTDALSAQSLAAKMDAPLLITDPVNLPNIVLDEILRLDPDKILILGGTSSVSSSIESSLKGRGFTTERLAGQTNRYQTNAVINYRLGTSANRAAILVSGEDYQEAIAAAVPAAKYKLPLILTMKDSLPEDAEYLFRKFGIKQIIIIGSTSAVSENVERYLKRRGYQVKRINGTDVYQTSINVAVSPDIINDFNNVLIAKSDYKDVLGIGTFANKINATLLYSQADVLPGSVYNFLKKKKSIIKNIYIVGNTSSISYSTEYKIAEATGKLK